MNKNEKIILAGSHGATTAYSIIQEIKEKKLNLDVYWLGNKWSDEDKKSISLEYKILPPLGVTFIDINSGKIENKATKNTIKAFFKIPFSFLASGMQIFKLKPDIVLSFGGSAGFYASFWGKVLGKKIIIHEQTAAAGRANIFSSFFADKIALSRKESLQYFPRSKTVIVGDPISKEITSMPFVKPKKKVRTIFVTGGSRGSRWINEAFSEVAEELSQKYTILWQCGERWIHENKNQYTSCKLFGQLMPYDYAKLIAKSDIVISRAGANTCSELLFLKKPCILIPIPWSYLNEQHKNADFLKKAGLAQIINQHDLRGEKLLEEINLLISNYTVLLDKLGSIQSPDRYAAEKLVRLICDYVK